MQALEINDRTHLYSFHLKLLAALMLIKNKTENWTFFFPRYIYPVEDVGPALGGDALVDSQHGKAQVIKMSNSVVWAWPPTSTFSAID